MAGPERDPETGQFVAGGQPQPPAEPQKYSVTIGGQTVEVTLDELRAGYMRQEDYTRKTQELAQDRRDQELIEAQRGRPQGATPGFAAGVFGPGPASPSEGAWGRGFAGTGAPPAEQPFGGPTLQPPPASPYAYPGMPPGQYAPVAPGDEDEDEYASMRTVHQLAGQLSALQRQVDQERVARENLEAARRQEMALAQLAQQYPEYNPGDVNDVLLQMGPSERAAYERMPIDVAHRLVFLEFVRPVLAAQETGGQPGEQPAPAPTERNVLPNVTPPAAPGPQSAGTPKPLSASDANNPAQAAAAYRQLLEQAQQRQSGRGPSRM